MMQAVAYMAAAAGADCQLSLERYMACGMGTCQSCVCKIRDDSDQGWRYKLCCSDGPVFDAAEILWD
jgi:dihydroorotate dehydrogenase electron transfer subunit